MVEHLWRAAVSGAAEVGSRETESVQLTPDMQRVVHEQRLGFVATVSPDGRPNLSPKGTTVVLDDQHLMFADISSPGTVRNLETNPNVDVNVVDPIARRGYRFEGPAQVHTSGATFERGLTRLHELGSSISRARVRSIVVIEVSQASPILSPAYDDGVSEEAISQRWMQHYRSLHPPR